MKDGDIVNVDVTSILNKYYADANKTFFVGRPDPKLERLYRWPKNAWAWGCPWLNPETPSAISDGPFKIMRKAKDARWSGNLWDMGSGLTSMNRLKFPISAEREKESLCARHGLYH